LPPEIIESGYSKELTIAPQSLSSYLIHSQYFISAGRIFCLKEQDFLDVVTYSTCITIVMLTFSEGNDAFIADEIMRLKGEGNADTDIINQVLAMKMHVGEEDTSRFVFQNCTIETKNKAINGKQVRGAYTDERYANNGLAYIAYQYVLNKYMLLASDNLQTPKGARFWVVKLFDKLNKIGIYDQNSKEFKGLLNDDLKMKCGSLVWSSNLVHSELGDALDVDIDVDIPQTKVKTVLFALKDNEQDWYI